MRVIAGTARGVVLEAPRGRETRPITDRVKETLFGVLGARVLDARMLDLYAGSGAIGIEALSRGAASCTFVERGREALAVLRRNLERARVQDAARIAGQDVGRFLAGPGEERYDLVMLDPPFAEHAILAPLQRVAARLSPGATVVVRTFWRTDVPEAAGLAIVRRRRLGETMLTFLEPAAAVVPAPTGAAAPPDRGGGGA